MSLDDEAARARFDDNLKQKLSTINETQAAINTAGDWIIFHWRHAERSSQLWFDRIKDSSSSKRLALIYLVNEVGQNAKNRGKVECNNAFARFLPSAFEIAYSSSPTDTQKRLRYVVQIWRERQTFEASVIEAIDGKLKEVDEARLKNKRPLLGGSLLSSAQGSNDAGANARPGGSAPPGLEAVEGKYLAVMKAKLGHRPAVSKVNSEYEQLVSSGRDQPQPSVHAARLTDLLKTLSSAADAVAATMDTREQLFMELDKVMQNLRTDHDADLKVLQELRNKEPDARARQEKVEQDLLLGEDGTAPPQQQHAVESIEAPSNPFAMQDSGNEDDEAEETFEKPEVEPLTPPPVESFTPPLQPPEPDLNGDIYANNSTAIGYGQQQSSLTPPDLPASTLTATSAPFQTTSTSTGPVYPARISDPRLANANVPNTTTYPADPRLKRMRPPSANGTQQQTQTRHGDNPFANDMYAVGQGVDSGDGSGSEAKRRKSSHQYQHHEKTEFEDFLKESGGDAMEGIDADVVGMLR